jgi:hypothetical protein
MYHYLIYKSAICRLIALLHYSMPKAPHGSEVTARLTIHWRISGTITSDGALIPPGLKQASGIALQMSAIYMPDPH